MAAGQSRADWQFLSSEICPGIFAGLCRGWLRGHFLLDRQESRPYASGTMADSGFRKLGRLIQRMRIEQGIRSAEELSRRLRGYGYRISRSYLASVESGALMPSRNLLRGCERVFGLARGHFLRYAALHHAEQWAERADVSLSEYLEMVEAGIKSVGPASAGDAETGGGAVPGNPHDVESTPAAAPKKRLIRDSLVKHRIANWFSMRLFFGQMMPVCT